MNLEIVHRADDFSKEGLDVNFEDDRAQDFEEFVWEVYFEKSDRVGGFGEIGWDVNYEELGRVVVYDENSEVVDCVEGFEEIG